MAQMAEAPISERAEKHEWRGKEGHPRQQGVRASTLGQVADCREMTADSGFFWLAELPNRQRRAKECGSDGFDRKTADRDLYAMSKRMLNDMQRNYGELSDSLESEQAEDGLIRVDPRSDSRSMDVPEDAEERSMSMSPIGKGWEDPPTLPLEIVKRFIEN